MQDYYRIPSSESKRILIPMITDYRCGKVVHHFGTSSNSITEFNKSAVELLLKYGYISMPEEGKKKEFIKRIKDYHLEKKQGLEEARKFWSEKQKREADEIMKRGISPYFEELLSFLNENDLSIPYSQVELKKLMANYSYLSLIHVFSDIPEYFEKWNVAKLDVN